jgi:hypothetical protein
MREEMTMTSGQKKALAAATVAALAAAGVVAVVRYRQGHKLTSDDHEAVNELDSRLGAVEEGRDDPETRRFSKLLGRIQLGGADSVRHLRSRLKALRSAKLDDDQAIGTEAVLDRLDAGASQEGM